MARESEIAQGHLLLTTQRAPQRSAVVSCRRIEGEAHERNKRSFLQQKTTEDWSATARAKPNEHFNERATTFGHPDGSMA